MRAERVGARQRAAAEADRGKKWKSGREGGQTRRKGREGWEAAAPGRGGEAARGARVGRCGARGDRGGQRAEGPGRRRRGGRRGRRRGASAAKLLGLRPGRVRVLVAGRREERSGARRGETRNLRSPSAAGRKEAAAAAEAGRRPGGALSCRGVGSRVSTGGGGRGGGRWQGWSVAEFIVPGARAQARRGLCAPFPQASPPPRRIASLRAPLEVGDCPPGRTPPCFGEPGLFVGRSWERAPPLLPCCRGLLRGPSH